MKRIFNLVGKEIICEDGFVGYKIELFLNMNKVEESEETDNRGDFLIRLYELNIDWYDKYLVDERIDSWGVSVNI